jgi:outer membrane lipoprotein-sorting protein
MQIQEHFMSKYVSKLLFTAAFALSLAQTAIAQTADEVIEKHLAALGGRAALAKLKSRSMKGTISLTTPAGELSGAIEVLNQEPNKARTFVQLDLSAIGAGQMIQDQRFDGTTGYIIDSLQGNRDITGQQLETMKNGTFPHPLLNYKDAGTTVELGGKEKLGEREAYVLVIKFKSGTTTRQYIDSQSYLPIKQVVKIDVPQLGTEIEQTTELSDFRDVDGVKVPFLAKTTSAIQTLTVRVSQVQHNIQIDQALFSKPAAK